LFVQQNLDVITPDTVIWWIRRDLRLDDNAALYCALKENSTVLPMFIFDTNILNQLDDKSDKRVEFIYRNIQGLKDQLEVFGSSLLIFYGSPVDIFSKLNPKGVYTNHDYEPYARARDQEVETILTRRKVFFKTFKDQVIFEKDEILKADKKPYTIFTPYSRVWKEALRSAGVKSYATEKYFNNLQRTKPLSSPSLQDIGFSETGFIFPERVIKTSVITNYEQTRNFPAVLGTSRLSVHLRFGTVSIRRLVNIALKKSTTWLNELIWREFYQMILWHFPQVVDRSFKSAYDRIEWINSPHDFDAWCDGKTGYPLVDAGMRELNQTGFMHNRIRMVTASFLTKHLLIDWRWGEAYFAKKLLDYELASNNGGWQWAAGSGCDAAPYFRIFNPELQMKKFDPEQRYIKKWIPEFQTQSYPAPIVDHKSARARAIRTFKSVL
jgi:deoxyribodipyrimidine photo-lyase